MVDQYISLDDIVEMQSNPKNLRDTFVYKV